MRKEVHPMKNSAKAYVSDHLQLNSIGGHSKGYEPIAWRPRSESAPGPLERRDDKTGD